MNAQETIDRLMSVRKEVSILSAPLDGPTQFVDRVNTLLIDAMLVLESTFIGNGSSIADPMVAGMRVATVHELIRSAWEGREPLEAAREIVADLKAGAVIGNAMKGVGP